VQEWPEGTLDMSFIEAQRDLQVVNLAAMRAYGMTPVLPGFAGHVPAGLRALYPNASFTTSADWNGFNASYSSVTLLEPTDPLFTTVGEQFYRLLIAAFGTDSYYNSDLYNEMTPRSNNLTYLAACNAATYGAMAAVDPNAVYGA
jgi:alpha-N-acetylglucosaminidase